MGVRVSIQFMDSAGRLSAVLFDHEGGMERVRHAQQWLARFKPSSFGQHFGPDARREASRLMVRYVADIGSLEQDESLWLECSTTCGDASDYEHHVLSTALHAAQRLDGQ